MQGDVIDEVGITKEELDVIVAELKCSTGTRTRVRKLIDSFPSVRMFRAANDLEIRRHGRYGEAVMKLVVEIKDRCFYLERHKEERYRLNRSFSKYLDERDAKFKSELKRLDPVFSTSDLQVALLIMDDVKLEYIDLAKLNDIRYGITEADRVIAKRRYEEKIADLERRHVEELERLKAENAGLSRLVAERLDGIAKEREEREEEDRKKKERREKERKERQEKGEKNGAK